MLNVIYENISWYPRLVWYWCAFFYPGCLFLRWVVRSMTIMTILLSAEQDMTYTGLV